MARKRLYFLRNGQTRVDSVKVIYDCQIQNVANLAENFSLEKIFQTNTFLESELFHSFTDRLWTLSELIFFCNNNEICLQIKDQLTNTIEISYGICSGIPTVKGDFNSDYNDDYFI